MNAKEMFEALGYKSRGFEETSYYYIVEYYKTHINSEEEYGLAITFDNDKSFYLECQSRHCEPIIDLPLYKAITQQMKELGWIK